jgi:hypothetical protein
VLRSITKQINKKMGQPSLVAPFFLILLFLSSIIVLPVQGLIIRFGRELLLEWGIITLIGLFLWEKRTAVIPLNKWVTIFLFWSLVTAVLHYNKFSMTALNVVVLYTILYYVIQNIVKKDTVNTVLNVICIAALVQVFWCFLQYFGLDPIFTKFDRSYGWCVGFLDNGNLLSAFLAFSIPAFFRKRWVYCLPVLMLPFLQPHMKGGFLALFIAGIVYALLAIKPVKIKVYALSVIGVVIIWYVVFFAGIYNFTHNERIRVINPRVYYVSNHLQINGNIATLTPDIVHKESMLGFGLGQFRVIWPQIYNKVYPGNKDERMDQAHNEYLQVKFEQGWIGLVIVLGFVLIMSRNIYRLKNVSVSWPVSAGIVAVFVNSFVNFPFHIAGLPLHTLR